MEQGSAGAIELPEPPAVAREIFGTHFAMARAYAEELADTGVSHGLIGPREAPRLWDRHLINCAAITDAIDPGAAVADIGSGAGLPGLVIAIRRPDVQMTLIEPLLRRVVWLEETVERLGLENVTICRGKAEVFAGELSVDVVTSRAVARLELLAHWSAPLLRVGGRMLAMKGSSVGEEIDAAAQMLKASGFGPAEVLELGLATEPTVVAAATKLTEPDRTARSKQRVRAAKKTQKQRGRNR